jgi:hypothetical protein
VDEDLEMEEQSLEAGLPFGGDASATLAKLSQQYAGMGSQLAAERKATAEARAARFKAAEEAIRQQRFGAPSTREQLFALAAALASPRKYKGLAGTLSRVVPAIGEMSSLQSKAENQRAAALQQLRQQYEEGTETARMTGLEGERDALGKLLTTYAPLAKPRPRRTALGPTSERVIDLDTGEEIVPPSDRMAQIPPQAIEALRAHMADPSVPSAIKIQSRRSFETTFGVPVANVLGGQ